MPTPVCSKCRRTIPPDEINVANDVAYCRDCNISYRLSELTFGGDISVNLDLNHPPKDAWFVNDGGGTVIGATNRSLGTAFGLLFFALFMIYPAVSGFAISLTAWTGVGNDFHFVGLFRRILVGRFVLGFGDDVAIL